MFVDGGASNTITTMTSLSAVSGLAIEATTGDDTVINQGLVVGNVDLGSGSNRFASIRAMSSTSFTWRSRISPEAMAVRR